MTDESVPCVDGSLPAVSHIAFVVDNLEDGIRRFNRLLGIGPWMLYRYEPPRLSNTTFRGDSQEYSMRVAFTDVKGPIDWSSSVLSGETLKRFMGWLSSLRDRLGLGPTTTASQSGPRNWSMSVPNPGVPGVNVELIEPLDGKSTYTEHLEAGGTGIHHVGCFAYDDPHRAVEAYEDAGIPVVQSGVFEGLEFWYLDMSDHLDGLILEIAANLWAIPEPDDIYSG